MFTDRLGMTSLSKDILSVLGLINDGDYTNAALLCADSNPFHGLTIIRYGHTSDITMEQHHIDHESIFEMIDTAVDIFQRYYCYQKIDGITRVDKQLLPFEAFKLALIFMLIHKTWNRDKRIEILMFEDKIEIKLAINTAITSHGESILKGITHLKNQSIANLFYLLGLYDPRDINLKSITDAYRGSYTKPRYDLTDGSFTISLPVMIEKVTLSSSEQYVVSHLSKTLLYSRKDLERSTSFSRYQLNRILKRLVEKGLVRVHGQGPKRKYTCVQL